MMKYALTVILLFTILCGCTVENTTGFESQAPSGEQETTSQMITETTYIPHVLPQTEGLVLPDERHIKQFSLGSESNYHKEDYIWPTNYNIPLGKEKGLYTDESRWTEDFFIIQAMYRKVFETYLNELLEIESHSALFYENADFPEVRVPDDVKNYYWYCSTLNMEYLYLRNNLCVERLSAADLAVFRAYHERGEYDVTQELTEIVERTFPDVIRVFTQEDADESSFDIDINNLTTTYSHAGGEKDASNDAIVFEIGIYRNLSLYALAEYSDRDTNWIQELAPKLQEAFQAKMPGHSIEVFCELYY